MATPHVAGACALAWSRNPGLSHLEVKEIILNTVDELEVLDGNCVTGGRLNLHNAVRGAACITLSKGDDLDPNESVLPGDYITYTIYYANPANDPCEPNYIGTLNNVSIVDYLPEEINDVNASDGGVYDANTGTVTWEIGTLPPGEGNSVTVEVRVSTLAEPLGTITNVCVIEANEGGPITAVEITDVNWWNPGIIYVDDSAAGSKTGMSWQNAYTYLESALERARKGCGSQIWVAEGTYNPDTTFDLVDGLPLYGGFDGNETSLEQRDWIENETVLDGNGGVQYVVSANDINETSIDGFTITGGQFGIYSNNSCPNVVHNRIEELTIDGIWGRYSDLNITNCLIADNGRHGILCEPEYDSSLNVQASEIRDNHYNGIDCTDAPAAAITNTWIHHNRSGVVFDSADTDPVIRNSTIADNSQYGIFGWATVPNISNCIIWGNTLGSFYSGTYAVTYSCIEDCDDADGTGNICGDSNDPNFLDPNNGDYHLTFGSPCVDTADTNLVSEGETDIDGHPRVMGYEVDMGADEDYPNCDADDYNEWANVVGRPDCWCYPRQCHGDADNASETKGNYWVYVADLTILLSGWGKAIGDMSDNEICADFDHAAETKGDYRVYVADLGILLANWGTSAVDANCLDCEQVERSRAGGPDIEEILKLLAELWLDENVKDAIDEDVWDKFIESIK
jgi:hypothetical protein